MFVESLVSGERRYRRECCRGVVATLVECENTIPPQRYTWVRSVQHHVRRICVNSVCRQGTLFPHVNVPITPISPRSRFRSYCVRLYRCVRRPRHSYGIARRTDGPREHRHVTSRHPAAGARVAHASKTVMPARQNYQLMTHTKKALRTYV